MSWTTRHICLLQKKRHAQGDSDKGFALQHFGDEVSGKAYRYDDDENGKYVRFGAGVLPVGVSASSNNDFGYDKFDDILYPVGRRVRSMTYDNTADGLGTLNAREGDSNFDDIERYYFNTHRVHNGYDDWRNAYNRAKDEMDHYINGDYEYRKGQGWRLKNESRRRRGRLLRESWNNYAEEEKLRQSAYRTLNRKISQYKKKLVAKATKNGLYENFGEKECSALRDEFSEYLCGNWNDVKPFALAINEFENWCAYAEIR